jgi:hypothetical protein
MPRSPSGWADGDGMTSQAECVQTALAKEPRKSTSSGPEIDLHFIALQYFIVSLRIILR